VSRASHTVSASLTHELPRAGLAAIHVGFSVLSHLRVAGPSVSGYAWTRYDLGLLALRSGDRAAAVRELGDGLALFRKLDYGWAIGRCAWALAMARLHDRALDEAGALLVEALDRHRAVGDTRGLAQCLEAAGGVLGARGRGDAGARLLGAAAECRQRLAAPLT